MSSKHATTEGVEMSHRVLVFVSAVAVLVALVSSGAAPAVAQTAAPGQHGVNLTSRACGTSAPSRPWNGPKIWPTGSS